MAKQKSLFKMTGTMEDLTFYERNGEYFVRKKSNIDRKRFKSDPAFLRSRENASEFGKVAGIGKAIRNAFHQSIVTFVGSGLVGRLNSVLVKVKNADPVNVRGLRTVVEGLNTIEGKAHLIGFNLNNMAPLQKILGVWPKLDTKKGIVSIPNFEPKEMIFATPEATHVQFRSEWARIYFETGGFNSVVTTSPPIALDSAKQHILLEPLNGPQGPGRDLFVLTLQFFQVLNGSFYPLNQKELQPGIIIGVV